MNDADGARARSFGAIADDYDRLRPGPPPAALDWMLPSPCDRAIDVGAGTGLFTRALHERVSQVVGVEPDERMRRVLRARSPGVHVVGATAEAIPVRDGWADAVCVSSAWHWMDPVRTAGEVTRVLRDGGRLGLIWTSRDREVDWVRELDRLRTSAATESDADVAAQREEPALNLPDDALLTNVEDVSVEFSRLMQLDDLVSWLGTYSQVIVATPTERAAGLARARAALEERFGAGAVVDVPMRSWCWRAERVAR